MVSKALLLPGVMFLVLGASCVGAAPEPRSAATEEASAATGDPGAVERDAAPATVDGDAPVCEVFCEGAQISSVQAEKAVLDAESHTVEQTENANAVLAGLNDRLLACYQARVRVAPRSQGSVTFDILVGPDGGVLRVDATGGETLGSAKACMIDVIRGAQFAPPHGGGTSNIRAPFALRLQASDEST